MLLGDLLGMIGGIIFNNRSGNGVEFQENTRQAKRTQAQIALVLSTVPYGDTSACVNQLIYTAQRYGCCSTIKFCSGMENCGQCHTVYLTRDIY